MDNQQILGGQPQPAQPIQPTPGVTPAAGIVSGAPVAAPITTSTMVTGVSGGSIVATESESGSKTKMPILGIAGLIITTLGMITFIGLFIWMNGRYNSARDEVDTEIAAAVTEAVNEKEIEMEKAFTEREKNPYRTFAGQSDYGELTFEYPKTWSVYEAKSADTGGDFEAYLNPDKVYTVGGETINSIRVIIKDQGYDQQVKQYENYVKNGKLTTSIRPINGENATLYRGELPGTSKLQGIAAVFKIRDKTCIIQTDAFIFEDDFNHALDTVKYSR